jgi:hypothetical protein
MSESWICPECGCGMDMHTANMFDMAGQPVEPFWCMQCARDCVIDRQDLRSPLVAWIRRDMSVVERELSVEEVAVLREALAFWRAAGPCHRIRRARPGR